MTGPHRRRPTAPYRRSAAGSYRPRQPGASPGDPRGGWHDPRDEQGLFAVMRENEEYTRYVDALAAEHRELAAFLDTLDLESAAQRGAFVRAVEELYTHISKEEDGLFPASLTELTGEQWDRSIDAWRTVHSR
ncbi:hemerythrin domain-containing protein [Streptomyces sp. NPDC054995]